MSAAPDNSVAIIGLALRLPGAQTPSGFWQNLCRGVESITFFSADELLAAGVPQDLLDNPAYVKAAPILEDVDKFDAGFFGYSPKEAMLMDPQNRLLLEVSWAAFEDAGYQPGALGETVVGVFCGGGSTLTSYQLCYSAHPAMQGQTAGLEHINNDRDFLSTRISYKLNLTGPSLTVQAACSTSLVAVHLACQSLLARECDMALAGASAVRIPHQRGYLAERGSVHSADGHCRPFDAAGSGTIFGSGVAAVLLKPTPAALEDGDHIYAVIRSTAVTNDGAEKVSFTAASAAGQARAVVEALALANVSADSIGYVECHATGTPAGDPVEIQALTRAFRLHTDRKRFCAVGSVKGNIGHPEQAAGIAGLIKVALSLDRGSIPPTLGFRNPNPKIPFDDTPFYVQTELSRWPAGPAPRRAGVNSLGIGGTNAFILLEEAPPQRPRNPNIDSSRIFCISAQSGEALRTQAENFLAHLNTNPMQPFEDICYTAAISRTAWKHRFASVTSTSDELKREFDRFISLNRAPRVTEGPSEAPRVAFLFSGQGSQYAGMSRELYYAFPEFREPIELCDSLLKPHLKISIPELLFQSPEIEARLHQTLFTQPILFAVEYALARLWLHWGVQPSAVMGHSLGEIVAACVAGALELREALEFVVERARLMQSLPTNGIMEAFFGGAETVGRATEGLEARLSIAAVNSPSNTVVAGESDAVAAVRERLALWGVASKRLNVSHAFHSPLVEPILPDLERAAAKMRGQPPRIPLISNVTGRSAERAPDAAYWRMHARRTVRFLEGIQALHELGCSAFLEIGPGSALVALGGETLGASAAVWLSSLNRVKPDTRSMLESAARLYLDGWAVNWSKVYCGSNARRVSLPTYPFTRNRFWLPPAPSKTRPGTAGADVPADIAVDLDWNQTSPYLADHRIYDLQVIPTAAILESAIAVGRDLFGGDPIQIEDFVCYRAVVIENGTDSRHRMVMSRQNDDAARFRLVTLNGDGAAPELQNATGVLRRIKPVAISDHPPEGAARELIASRFPRKLEPHSYYERLRQSGLNYGPAFQRIRNIWLGQDEAISRVSISPRASAQSAGLHPALLDACIHLYPALIPEALENVRPGNHTIPLPSAFERLIIHQPGAFTVWSHLTLRPQLHDASTHIADIRLYDHRRRLVAALEGLCLKRIGPDALSGMNVSALSSCLYKVSWEEAEELPPVGRAEGNIAWLLFADSGGLAADLAKEFERSGHSVHFVHPGSSFGSLSPRHWSVDISERASFDALLEAVAASEQLPFRGAICLWGLDLPGLDGITLTELKQAEEGGIRSALYLVQALMSANGYEDTRLWFATRGAQSVPEPVPSFRNSGVSAGGHPANSRNLVPSNVEPLPALLWGMARSMALEAPRLWGGIVDLPVDRKPAADEAFRLSQIVLGPQDERQIALRGNRSYVPRLTRLEQNPEPRPPTAMAQEGTYLITGGLGMLGVKMATWLAEKKNANSIVLAGRRPPDRETERTLAGLKQSGVCVRVFAVDLSDEENVRQLFETIQREMPPLKGVVHCAGVLADGLLGQMTWDAFTRATAPKAWIAFLLHRYTRHLALDFFLLQSSLLSLTGSAGQANYTAGNAFLDALSGYRIAHGLPSMVVNWGPWAEAGMASTSGERGDARWRSRGIASIRPALGMQFLKLLFDRPVDQVTVVQCDWARYVHQLPRPDAFYSKLCESRTECAPGAIESQAGVRDRLASATPELRRQIIIETLTHHIAEELGLEQDIDIRKPLEEFGVDSLISVTLVNRIEAVLGVRIPLANLLQSPNVEELGDAIGSMLDTSLGRVQAARRMTGLQRYSARGEGWLVLPKPRPGAEYRLFCFNFAGGGAATYRPWADLLAPSIELVAIEPPGRATRLHEPPITTLEALLDGLIPAMLPLLDKPCALIGHCLGGLNLFEATRHCLRHGVKPAHLFVSGSRPPHRLHAQGEFEESLFAMLLNDPEFDPLRPLHEQPDYTFAKIIRQFNIGATEDFLAQPELRSLLLPAIRADFEIVYRYRFAREPAWDIPITAFNGLDDPYVTRDDCMQWSQYTSSEFRIYFRKGSHFLIVDDRDFIVSAINDTLVRSKHGFIPRTSTLDMPAAAIGGLK